MRSNKESNFRYSNKEIGPHAKPDSIQFTPALPKTRSGKNNEKNFKKDS